MQGIVWRIFLGVEAERGAEALMGTLVAGGEGVVMEGLPMAFLLMNLIF